MMISVRKKTKARQQQGVLRVLQFKMEQSSRGPEGRRKGAMCTLGEG